MAVAGVATGNQNILSKRIERALQKQPARGVRVALLCKSQPSRIAEWEAKEITPETALAIEQAIIDHAEELGFLVVDFQLVWEAEDGRPIISPNISWRRPVDESNPLDNAQLDGGDRTTRLQEQRHSEALMRIMIQTIQGQVRMYAEQNQQLHQRILEAHESIDDLRAELALAQDALAKRLPAGEEPEEKLTPLQGQALAMLGQYLPVLIASQMGGTPRQVPPQSGDPQP